MNRVDSTAELYTNHLVTHITPLFPPNRCGPCQSIAPIFVELSESNPDVEFVKVDVDESEDVAAHCNISAMPTFQFYKDGAKVEELRGASASQLKQLIAKHK